MSRGIDVPDELTRSIAQAIAPALAAELRAEGLGPPRWVDAQGAADHLAFSLSKVQKLTARNEMPHHRHDGRVHYRTDELDAWLTKH